LWGHPDELHCCSTFPKRAMFFTSS
jgi:hypothetical protein